MFYAGRVTFLPLMQLDALKITQSWQENPLLSWEGGQVILNLCMYVTVAVGYGSEPLNSLLIELSLIQTLPHVSFVYKETGSPRHVSRILLPLYQTQKSLTLAFWITKTWMMLHCNDHNDLPADKQCYCRSQQSLSPCSRMGLSLWARLMFRSRQNGVNGSAWILFLSLFQLVLHVSILDLPWPWKCPSSLLSVRWTSAHRAQWSALCGSWSVSWSSQAATRCPWS